MSLLTYDILSTSPFAIAHHRIITDGSGTPVDYEFLEVNPVFEELVGLQAVEIKGKKASEILSDGMPYYPDHMELFSNVAEGDTKGTFEYLDKSRNRWYEVQVWSTRRSCFATLHTDISDKKILEGTFEERRKELNFVYDMARISEKKNATVDNICQTLAAYLPKAFQFPEMTCCRIVISDRDYQSGNYKETAQAINRDITINGEKAGSIIVGYLKDPSDNSAGSFLQEENQLLDVAADWIGQFIRRKQSEAQLLETNMIINRSATVVFTWLNAPGWPVTYVSENVKNILGYEAGEFLSGKRNYVDCLHPDDAKRIANEVEFHQKAGKNEYVHEPYRIFTSDGEVKWVYDWSFIVRNDSGAITHFKGFIHDITQHKHAEDSLKESEYLLKMASRMVRFGGWSVDLAENRVIWSDMVAMIHEQPPEFCPSVEDGISYYAPEWKERIIKVFEECTSRGIPYDEEMEIITAKGNRRWVRTTGAAVKNSQGNIVKVQGAFQDITETMLSKQKLRDSEERFRKIFEIASLGIAQVDPNSGRILLVNKYYEEITGYSVDELLGMRFPELTHPDDRTSDWEIFQRAARGEISYRNEKRYIRKDGTIVWVRLHVAFIHDETGRPVSTVAICENITQRKEHEKLLKLQGKALKTAADGIVITDLKANIQWVNPAWSKLTGYSENEAMGQNPRILKSGEHDEAFFQNMWQKLNKGLVWNGEMINRRKDGTLYHEHQTITPMADSSGKVIHYIGIKQDITERKKTEEKLRISLEEKTTLLQELYHRTKNNMQVISSMLMIHAMRNGDEQFSALTRDINNRIKSMSLVHQKLYESNSLSYIPFDEYIRDLFSELSSSYLIRPGRIGLDIDAGSLKLLIDTAIPCGLVMNELISNSFKHAFPDDQGGTITVKASKYKDHTIHIRYSDNGIGLPSDFGQDKDTGMGWELIHMIVEYQLGGAVTCKDENGMACDIIFTDNKYSERITE